MYICSGIRYDEETGDIKSIMLLNPNRKNVSVLIGWLNVDMIKHYMTNSHDFKYSELANPADYGVKYAYQIPDGTVLEMRNCELDESGELKVNNECGEIDHIYSVINHLKHTLWWETILLDFHIEPDLTEHLADGSMKCTYKFDFVTDNPSYEIVACITHNRKKIGVIIDNRIRNGRSESHTHLCEVPLIADVHDVDEFLHPNSETVGSTACRFFAEVTVTIRKDDSERFGYAYTFSNGTGHPKINNFCSWEFDKYDKPFRCIEVTDLEDFKHQLGHERIEYWFKNFYSGSNRRPPEEERFW